MSNVFANHGVLFVPLPLVVAENWGDLSWAEGRLYVCLLLFANKHTAAELHLPAFVVSDYTKLHAETIPIARRALAKRGYIRWSKGIQGVTIYTLLNPLTGEALRPQKIGDKQFSGVYVYKSQDGRSERTRRKTQEKLTLGLPVNPPAWDEIGKAVPLRSVSMASPIRQDVTDQADSRLSQSLENTKLSAVLARSSKLTLKEGVLKVGGSHECMAVRTGGVERTEAIAEEKKGRSRGELLEHVAADPKVNIFAKKLNAKIVGLIDLRSGEQHGGDIEKGLMWEELDRRQRTLANGGRLLSREEAIRK